MTTPKEVPEVFYSGDEYADEDCTSGPIYDGNDEPDFCSPPLTEDVPVDYTDERRA